jgi:pimeloyl-ACP methyl ester carboxylesterase
MIAKIAAMVCGVLLLTAGLVSAEDKFFTSEGVRLRYVERGRGTPVVLLHGIGNWIEMMWDDTGAIDALATRYRVIALDFRGFGKSDKPHDPAAYGSHIAEDVMRLLDHVGIRQAHIVGYSMGARVASWLVVNRPDRLISVTLGASTYFLDTPAERQAIEATAKDFEQASLADLQAAGFDTKINDLQAVVAAQRGMTGLSINESEFSKTRVPIFHIIGSLDTTRLPASHRLKDTVLPRIDFQIVEGATHSGLQGLFRRMEFLEAVKAFLGRHQS